MLIDIVGRRGGVLTRGLKRKDLMLFYSSISAFDLAYICDKCRRLLGFTTGTLSEAQRLARGLKAVMLPTQTVARG